MQHHDESEEKKERRRGRNEESLGADWTVIYKNQTALKHKK
jgi:hypothetical protein